MRKFNIEIVDLGLLKLNVIKHKHMFFLFFMLVSVIVKGDPRQVMYFS